MARIYRVKLKIAVFRDGKLKSIESRWEAFSPTLTGAQRLAQTDWGSEVEWFPWNKPEDVWRKVSKPLVRNHRRYIIPGQTPWYEISEIFMESHYYSIPPTEVMPSEIDLEREENGQTARTQ